MNESEEPSSQNITSPDSEILPNNREVLNFLLKTLKHCCHFHYFASRLGGIGSQDPELPHDLEGYGNKLSWEVVRGLALQFRDSDKVYFEKVLQPSVFKSRDFHRNQYHHKKWNGNTPNPNASVEDMYVGALDTNLALLEPRRYNGGSHSYDETLRIIRGFPEHKARYCLELLGEMKKIPQPRLDLISDLMDFDNIGLESGVYEQISDAMQKAVFELRERGYPLRGTGLGHVSRKAVASVLV